MFVLQVDILIRAQGFLCLVFCRFSENIADDKLLTFAKFTKIFCSIAGESLWPSFLCLQQQL